MTKPATDLPLTPRERLRWRRAMDVLLADEIFGRVVRDDAPLFARLNVGDVAAVSAMVPTTLIGSSRRPDAAG